MDLKDWLEFVGRSFLMLSVIFVIIATLLGFVLGAGITMLVRAFL